MRKLEFSTVRPSGPDIIDRCPVEVGGFITLDGYSSDYFSDGDVLKVLGYRVVTDEVSPAVMHRGLYFGQCVHKMVAYVVGVYSQHNGELEDTLSIYHYECAGAEHSFATHMAEVKSEARLMKPAIKALRAAGLENQARVLEGQRAAHFKDIKSARRQTMRERAERDALRAKQVLARMSLMKHAKLTYADKQDNHKVRAIDCFIQKTDDKKLTYEFKGYFYEVDWTDVKRLEVTAA